MRPMKNIFFLIVCSISISTLVVSNSILSRQSGLNTSCSSLVDFDRIQKQIDSYRGDAQKIINLVLHGSEKHKTYDELALFCDTFGPRLSGSKSLDLAIDYMSKKMTTESRLNVTAEPAMIPKWEVHEHWAEMVAPRRHKMSILALGGSVSTNGTLEREVALVHSMDELKIMGKAGLIEDKIVVYNYKFVSYPESVKYRSKGAIEAAKYGAKAALVRSVAPFSIYSPHTGMGSRSIPTAAITIEDAELIERLVNRQHKVLLKLFIATQDFGRVDSFNLLADITGASKPDEIVFVSGHMDSWYNTDGAMDDGGGMMVSYKAVDVLNKLQLRGSRTIRAILWTSEEFGLIGAQQYFNNHKHQLDNFKAVIESDEGTFKPVGLSFKNVGPLGQCALQQLLSLLSDIGATKLDNRYEGSDIELFTDAGVPGLSLSNENSKYFYFHHTAGDSITVEDPDDLDKSTILFAVTSYILSNLDIDLRN